MKRAPIPENEKDRIKAVHRMAILDTVPEERFDRWTREAVKKLNVSISTITIIDSEREWFKSCQGIDKKEGERTVSFCGHALLSTSMYVISDTLKDKDFKDNPMVVGPPFIRFYAGVALYDYDSRQPIGVFCVKDQKPRVLNLDEIGIITEIAENVEKELNKK